VYHNVYCSSELVTINLGDIVEGIVGLRLKRRYNLDAPKEVRGRYSDNAVIKERFGWEPNTHRGPREAYARIYDELTASSRARRPVRSC
jgi:GDP-D-mannose 3', 5'-epimerase